MSSMFRSPEEATPSDPESSSEGEEFEEVSTVADGQPLPAGDAESTEPHTLSGGIKVPPDVERNRQVNLFYSSLLEDFCTNKAIRTLKSQDPSGETPNEHDAKVQALAKANYTLLSKQLGPLGVVGQGYESDQWRDHRKTYREALEVMLDHALEEAVVPEPRGPTSKSLSPLATPFISTVPRPMTSRPIAQRMLTGVSIDTASVPSIRERFGNMQLHNRTQGLAGSPPTAMLSAGSGLEHPVFQPSRYRTDFAELGYIGRGGYGKVFQVVNHLDGQQYAIKKITLSPKRLRRLRNGAGNELEELLREIRALARLEHLNVVRYFGGWIEQSSVPITRDPPLLTAPAGAASSEGPAGNEDSFSLGIQFDEKRDPSVTRHDDGVILFGYSSNSVEKSNNNKRSKERRASQRTTSSSLTMKSFVQSTGEDDGDVESIPRPFGIPTRGQTSTDTTSSQNPFSDAEYAHPSHKGRDRAELSEPTWTLHIQMSLYPFSLATYLSQVSQASVQSITIGTRHCFHLLPSLRIILAILTGIEYLHTRSLIHRDLKPANIFLSIHKGTAHSPGCVDISPCTQCEGTDKEPTYIIPRIGDFGLVADIGPKDEYPPRSNDSSLVSIHHIAEPLAGSHNPSTTQHPLTDFRLEAIGTEFYRPPTKAALIDEKLDVFSLGVIAFELLWKFETRMERHTVLTDLKRGVLPPNFSESVSEKSGRLVDCLRGMLCGNAQKRLSSSTSENHRSLLPTEHSPSTGISSSKNHALLPPNPHSTAPNHPLLCIALPPSRQLIKCDVLYHFEHCYQAVRTDSVRATHPIQSLPAMYAMPAIRASPAAIIDTTTVYASRTLIFKARTVAATYSRVHDPSCINRKCCGYNIISGILRVADDRVYSSELIDSGGVYENSSVDYGGGEYKCYEK